MSVHIKYEVLSDGSLNSIISFILNTSAEHGFPVVIVATGFLSKIILGSIDCLKPFCSNKSLLLSNEPIFRLTPNSKILSTSSFKFLSESVIFTLKLVGNVVVLVTLIG